MSTPMQRVGVLAEFLGLVRNTSQASLYRWLANRRRHVRLSGRQSVTTATKLPRRGFTDWTSRPRAVRRLLSPSTERSNVRTAGSLCASTATIRLLVQPDVVLKMSAKLSMASSWSDVWTKTCPKLTITSAGDPRCVI